MRKQRPIRVVLAKVGLDGHDRGIQVVARGLREAGFDVTYAGLWQSPEAVVDTVLKQQADWLGLSVLNGAHMSLVPPVLERLAEFRLGHVGVVVGGIVPQDDVPRLLEMGVAEVFGPGTPIGAIADFFQGQVS